QEKVLPPVGDFLSKKRFFPRWGTFFPRRGSSPEGEFSFSEGGLLSPKENFFLRRRTSFSEGELLSPKENFFLRRRTSFPPKRGGELSAFGRSWPWPSGRRSTL